MTASFKRDLQKGKEYEQEFQRIFPHPVIPLDGKVADFKMVGNGNTIELKSDFHDTPNYFMERYSDSAKKSPGGPWQALEKGVFWFVVYFPKTNKYHMFKTKELVSKLDELAPILASRNIPNIRWITMGYIVPKTLLTSIEYKFSLKITRGAA